jgi:hypothetical protein
MIAAVRGGLRGLPWVTATALAVLLAFADGFWLTTVQGAVGSIQRSQDPFAHWLRDSAISFPLFLVAVVTCLVLARRRFGTALQRPRHVVAAGLLVAAAATGVGIVEMSASAALDYQLQSAELRQVELTHATAHSHSTTDPCNATCHAERETLSGDVRAIGYAAAFVAATNVVVVGWVLAMSGGSLAARTSRRRPATARV